MEFKMGDTVFLKSDPRTIMTVNDISSNGRDYFECIWFVQELLQIGHFHKDSLVKVDTK